MKKFSGIACAALIFILVGCASPPAKKDETVFFPPPPAPPRVQYLTHYTGLRDIEQQDEFDKFVVGATEDRKLDKPYGAAIYDGKIYVCDTNDTVIVFDLKGKKYGRLKGLRGPGKLIQPLNISIEEDGTKYVTDPIRGQVVAFDRNDEYLRAYGTPGNWKPVDAVAFEDRLYVADIKNAMIRVYNKKSGELVKTMGDKGPPEEKLNKPSNLTIDRDGYLFVTDIGRFQVVKFDRDGHFISAFGRLGDNMGHFSRPKGIALDREGHIFVVDAGFSNVQVFNKDGRLLLFFGGGGTGPGNLTLPAKVSIDYKNVELFREYIRPEFEADFLLLVTSQFGERMVNVFAYGKEKDREYPSDEVLMKEIEEKKKAEMEKLGISPKKAEEQEHKSPEEVEEAAP